MTTPPVTPELLNWTERQYVSQFSLTPLSLSIYIAGTLADPDSQAVSAQLALQLADGAVQPVQTYTAVRENIGQYQVTTASADTATAGDALLTWFYQVNSQPQQYSVPLVIGVASPLYDSMPLNIKDLIELVWIRFADCFDSATGGPNLQSYYQAHWSRGRMTQLMQISLMNLNGISQPWSNYSLDGSTGPMFPTNLWGGVLGTWCVTPETPVLTADLRWVSAGSLVPGDHLVGFDEQLDGLGKGRSFSLRRSVVEANVPARKRCFRIETTEGPVTCTYDHRWVVWDHRGRRRWVETQNLDPARHTIMSIGQPVLPPDADSGYLAGLYDGEGSLSSNHKGFGGGRSTWLYFAQNEGPVLDRFLRIVKSRGYDCTIESRDQSRSKVKYVYLRGGTPSVLRMLSEIRPERFVSRDLSDLWEGRQSKAMTFKRARIISITDVGIQLIAGLQTSTGTFIANGMLCHNTYCEAVKQLIRSYNEQPDLVGGGAVTRQDRSSYIQRWREMLKDEEPVLKSQLDMFKIRHMGLGNPRVLVSGGVYGRYAPTRIAGSVAARPRMWARWY